MDNFQNVIGCLHDDILDVGNNLFQSHTPCQCKYVRTPSPHHLEVLASPIQHTWLQMNEDKVRKRWQSKLYRMQHICLNPKTGPKSDKVNQMY